MRPVYLRLSIALASILLCLTLAIFFLRSFYGSHLFPHTFVADLDLSNFTYPEAMSLLTASSCSPSDNTFCPPVVTLSFGDTSLSSPGAELSLQPNFSALISHQLDVQSSLSLFDFLQSLYTHRSPQFLSFSFIAPDDSALTPFLREFETRILHQGAKPQFTLAKPGVASSLAFTQGETSRSLDYTTTLTDLKNNLTRHEFFTTASVALHDSSLDETAIANYQSIATTLISRSITLTAPTGYPALNFSLALTDQDLISCLNYDRTARININCLAQFTDSLREQIDSTPQNPALALNANSTHATNFTPPTDGLVFNQAQTVLDIQKAMVNFINFPASPAKISLPVTVAASAPAVSLASTNSLGIKEIIGFGESYYAHSSANRIHNVALAASRISGAIVAPGQEFSFNKTLGDVTLATGFKEEYIISEGASTIGVGGGVCQVSSTLFRSLLNSGLNITRRLPHSFRVTYYEINNDPGFDATVYTGETDLRFINDTDHHVLIYMQTNSPARYMFATIYGTSDGRSTQVVDYVKTPLGGGAMRTSFTNIIKDKNGQELDRHTYVSNYAVPKSAN